VRAMLRADEKERMVEGLQDDLQAFNRLAQILEQRLSPNDFRQVMAEFRRVLGIDTDGMNTGTNGQL
jgi:uncharacterized protein YmfQ (DUF2313 family)